MPLGTPHLHLRVVDSTNTKAKELARSGTAHGTMVTADEQTVGRGRRGRSWFAPPGQALLCSLILREFDELLTLRAGVAVADVIGAAATVKWPNDVLVHGKKVAGVLAEAQPPESWAVLGIGVNVAVDANSFPSELRESAGALGYSLDTLTSFRDQLVWALERRLAQPQAEIVKDINTLNALKDQPIRWHGGEGIARGIDSAGCLVVALPTGELETIRAGEIQSLRQLAS